MRCSAVLLVLSAAGAAGAVSAQQPPPTPPPQSVVVPSLPGEKNKETTVQPSGALKTDEAGWVKNGPGADPKAGAAGAGGAGRGTAPAGPGVGYPLPPAAGPTGPAVVAAANLSIRGVVKAYEKGKSITVLDANGRTKTVPLAEKAEVFEGLKAGDKVVLRVPLGAPADGKTADQVERQKPAKAPPKSKFSQAQTPAG